jgi:hypothetical protein
MKIVITIFSVTFLNVSPTVFRSVSNRLMNYMNEANNIKKEKQLLSNFLYMKTGYRDRIGDFKLLLNSFIKTNHKIVIGGNRTSVKDTKFRDSSSFFPTFNLAGGITCWYYDGILRNPLSGKIICGVQGLELTQKISSSHYMQRLIENIRQTFHVLSDKDGKSARLSTSPFSFTKLEGTSSFPSDGHYLSHKIFIFVDPSNCSQPLTEFRLNPIAPKRHLKRSNYKIISEEVSLTIHPSTGRLMTTIHLPTGRKLFSSQIELKGLVSSILLDFIPIIITPI